MKNYQNNRFTVLMVLVFISLVGASTCFAQSKVDDKEIIGAWVLHSMKYKGENQEYVTDSYNQIKIYRANGEYACTEVFKLSDGSYYIKGGHYGTYYFKNGKYIEMGRDASGHMLLVDKVTCKGYFRNRVDIWKKVVDMPEELIKYVVDKCKMNQKEPERIQKLTKKYIFNKR